MSTDAMADWEYADWVKCRRCSQCNEPFSVDEWEDRHTDADGDDCHAECCPVCHPPQDGSEEGQVGTVPSLDESYAERADADLAYAQWLATDTGEVGK